MKSDVSKQQLEDIHFIVEKATRTCCKASSSSTSSSSSRSRRTSRRNAQATAATSSRAMIQSHAEHQQIQLLQIRHKTTQQGENMPNVGRQPRLETGCDMCKLTLQPGCARVHKGNETSLRRFPSPLSNLGRSCVMYSNDFQVAAAHHALGQLSHSAF